MHNSTKKVLNVGACFILHPKGAVIIMMVSLKGMMFPYLPDAFFEALLGENKGYIIVQALIYL